MVNTAILGFVLCSTVCITGLLTIRAFKEGLKANVRIEEAKVSEKVVENEAVTTNSSEKVPDNIENIINEWLNGDTDKERG